MGGAVPPLPQYAFIVWCSVRGSTGTTLPFRQTTRGGPPAWGKGEGQKLLTVKKTFYKRYTSDLGVDGKVVLEWYRCPCA
jgi:hypothetical protein